MRDKERRYGRVSTVQTSIRVLAHFSMHSALQYALPIKRVKRNKTTVNYET